LTVNRQAEIPVPATVSRLVVALDVARALAMAGVIVMNWVAKFTSTARRNGDLDGPDALVRLLDPSEGVLSTRFAAVFVLVAGIGISLMARASSDHSRSPGSWLARAR
jgi:uncharacterized membrane protein YeiB